jgi:hypothetical protein
MKRKDKERKDEVRRMKDELITNKQLRPGFFASGFSSFIIHTS